MTSDDADTSQPADLGDELRQRRDNRRRGVAERLFGTTGPFHDNPDDHDEALVGK